MGIDYLERSGGHKIKRKIMEKIKKFNVRFNSHLLIINHTSNQSSLFILNKS